MCLMHDNGGVPVKRARLRIGNENRKRSSYFKHEIVRTNHKGAVIADATYRSLVYTIH